MSSGEAIKRRAERTMYLLIDDDANSWECQACRNVWYLTEGTPIENRMQYCPFCGAKIEGELYAD